MEIYTTIQTSCPKISRSRWVPLIFHRLCRYFYYRHNLPCHLRIVFQVFLSGNLYEVRGRQPACCSLLGGPCEKGLCPLLGDRRSGLCDERDYSGYYQWHQCPRAQPHRPQGISCCDSWRSGKYWGAIIGGVIIGLLETFTGGYISTSLREIVPYIILVFILLVKPYGLLAWLKSSESEDFNRVIGRLGEGEIDEKNREIGGEGDRRELII